MLRTTTLKSCSLIMSSHNFVCSCFCFLWVLFYFFFFWWFLLLLLLLLYILISCARSFILFHFISFVVVSVVVAVVVIVVVCLFSSIFDSFVGLFECFLLSVCFVVVVSALAMVSCHRSSVLSSFSRPPVGLVVKASASTAEDPGFESRLSRDFFRVESYQ